MASVEAPDVERTGDVPEVVPGPSNSGKVVETAAEKSKSSQGTTDGSKEADTAGIGGSGDRLEALTGCSNGTGAADNGKTSTPPPSGDGANGNETSVSPTKKMEAAGKKRKRGGYLSKQESLERLRKDVMELVDKKPKDFKDMFGTVWWGKFNRNAPWLPCLVVHPELIKENMTQLKSAKRIYSSKRNYHIIYWFGYGILSKQMAQNLLAFEDEEPNDLDNLPNRTITFIDKAKQEAQAIIDNNNDDIKSLNLNLFKENGAAQIHDEEGDSLCDSGSAMGTAGSTKRAKRTVRFVDALEPSWTELLISTTSNGNAMKRDDSAASSHSGHGADQESGHDEEMESSDDDDDDGDSEGDEYIPDGVDTGGSSNKKRKKKAKKNKKKRTPQDKLKRWTKKMKACNSNPKDKNAIKGGLKALKKMAKFNITTALLNQSDIGGEVRAACKHDNAEVKEMAKSVRKEWKAKLASEQKK